MIFLLLLVMFLGALGFAYVQTDANSKLRADNATLRQDDKTKTQKLTLLTHYVEDLGDVLKTPGAYTGRPSVEYEGATLDGIVGVVNPAELKARFAKLGGDIEIAATNGFEDLANAAVNKVSSLNRRISDIEQERDRVLAEKNATDQKFEAAGRTHTQEATAWRQNLDQTNANYNSSLNTARSQITGLQENVRRGETALAEANEAHTVVAKGLKNDIAKLQMHNTALVDKDRMRHPPSVADGKVLVAKSGLANAFIDLGRKDMLQPGTIFQIKNPNEASIKGYAKVLRVEQDRSEVLLYDLADKVGDPIRDGDQLFNDLYSPGANSKRTICMLGRFSYPYHKPELEVLLKSLGNKVVGKMEPGVDTVILGDDIVNESGDGFTSVQETDDYKLANQLGVEFVPLRKIRDIVKP